MVKNKTRTMDMTPLEQTQMTAWLMKVILIHLLCLFGLSYGLNETPHYALEWAIYQLITQDLHIITQINFSPYPLVCAITSIYALCSGGILFGLFLFGLKRIDATQTLFHLLSARFTEQIKTPEQVKFKDLVSGFFVWFFGLIMLGFHLFVLNDNNYNAKGGLYPVAFNSRFGIFVVQSIISFWVLGVLSLITIWLLNIRLWQQKQFSSKNL